jgi:multiple antibiotic resistance protein
MFDAWLSLIGVTIAALLPIANPFSAAPVFASLSAQMGQARRNQQARMAGIYMASVLLVSLIAGAVILEFFGISMPALRIAGGLIVAKVGFSMLSPAPEGELSAQDEQEAHAASDIAFTPIAMPLLSGPGSIAVTISMATTVDNPPEYMAVGIGIIIVASLSWMILRLSTQIIGFLGSTGVNVLTRLMGLILVCIGIQFVLTGLLELITDDAVVKLLADAYLRL